MIDKIAMITMLILYILVGLIALFTYLIVRGGSENKTDYERKLEDEEQMRFLKEYKCRRHKFGDKNK